jgi:CubicO group peptidase (beta-lactamase class C family)
MNDFSISRRDMLTLGLLAAAPLGLRAQTAAAAPAAAAPVAAAPPAGTNTMRTLDQFIAGYCDAMNAPGLTLALAGADGPIRVASYGHVDIAAKIPVLTSHLFEIGSITKSFVGLTLLQMREEGKVDLHAPIRKYLPWLAMQTDLGDILVHHLLTHSGGMPDDAPLFPSSPQRRPRQTFKPGSRFHYCNWGYDVLGRLIERLDGRPWAAAVTERIFKPIGMTDTSATITSSVRPRIAQSYVPLHDDRPYPRRGPLVPAGNLAVDFAAGSIASTPKDMALYMQMLLNRGAIPSGRVISEESFQLFSTPHIAAPIFGPTAGYGYGIAVDKLDGHTRLRHTGGMVSFMSALQLDLDARIGAFASINAQLGYRPNPVAEFALQLLRSETERAKPPGTPVFDAAAKIEGAESYDGVYTRGDGRRLEVKSAAERLTLIVDGHAVPLQQSDEGTFIADHPGIDLYPIAFEREPEASSAAGEESKRAVTALAYGPDWYARSGSKARPALEPSGELAKYTGKYYSENPWNGVIRIVQRQGQLWMGGTEPLISIGAHLFRIGANPWLPETAEFSEWVDGRANVLWVSGAGFQRIGAADS